MLVLSRLVNERIFVFKDGGDYEDLVEVTIVSVKNGKVRLGFSAGKHMKVIRQELIDQARSRQCEPEGSE